MSKSSIFKQVMNRTPRTNRFDLSHDLKMSFKMGLLVPTTCMEVLPGDRFNIKVQNMLRFAPMVSPVMDRFNVTTDYFFVPNRILWKNWERFITGGETSSPGPDPVLPYVNLTNNNTAPGQLGDYLGYPKSGAESYQASALPAAAYFKIWNEYYRDQNLHPQTYLPDGLVDGDNSAELEAILGNDPLKRAWMHDYFTSCLPFAQKGDDVTIPLTDSQFAPVVADGAPSNPNIARDTVTGAPVTDQANLRTGATGNLRAATNNDLYLDPNGSLQADVQSNAATINSLRNAFSLQRWLEKNARGGSRYIESMLVHFGVISSDKRLQRPELIGRVTQRMAISEVLSTATTDSTPDGSTTVTTPTGSLSGHGISAGGGKLPAYKAEEHGWIIGIINVQPPTSYFQGLHRSYARQTKYDFYWPAFANLGEQAVKNKEVYIEADVNPENREGDFGYIPRWSEYRYMNNRVAGQMKDTLDYWHAARKFAAAPALNADFIQADPTTRFFAVEDENEHQIYAYIHNEVSALRKMPRFAVPSILPG